MDASFKALSRIEFNVIATQPLLYLDNVKYRTYNVTEMGGGLHEIVHGHETSQSEFHMLMERGDRYYAAGWL